MYITAVRGPVVRVSVSQASKTAASGLDGLERLVIVSKGDRGFDPTVGSNQET